MFKSIKKFICNLFNIKACECLDEHLEIYEGKYEPEIPVHEDTSTSMHCGSHTRFIKSCPICVAIIKG